MGIRQSRRPVARVRLHQTARRLLDASTLCAISTVGPRCSAHVSTAYFAWDPSLHLIWLSDPGAAHSRNIRARLGAAIAVYGADQRWGGPDRGIQLFGSAHEASREEVADAERVYAARFPAFASDDVGGYRFYSFEARRLRLFDEATLGSGTFVTARVHRGGGLLWESTQISSSTS